MVEIQIGTPRHSRSWKRVYRTFHLFWDSYSSQGQFVRGYFSAIIKRQFI